MAARAGSAEQSAKAARKERDDMPESSMRNGNEERSGLRAAYCKL